MYLFFVRLFDPFTLLFLIVAAALANLWHNRTETRRRLSFLTVSFILLTLFCIPAIAYLAGGMFEWPYPPLKKRPPGAEAIVVLSGGVSVSQKDPEKVRLGTSTRLRCVHAVELYHQGAPCPIVLSGGKVDSASLGEPDAHIMHNFLIKMGIPKSDLIVEDASIDTHENAVESHRLLQERGIKNIILVTDAIHLCRASLCFRNQGLNVIPAGCNYRTPEFRRSLFQFLPKVSSAYINRAVFHELLGFLWFWLLGRL